MKSSGVTKQPKMRSSQKKHKKWLVAAMVILCIALGFVLYLAASIWSFGTYDEIVEADVVIVLGAGTDGYRPSPVFRERLNHAIQLYQDGFADKIILTGGIPEGALRSDASIARDYIVSKGIPEQDVLIEEQSMFTHENLQYAKKIMEDNALETALIVSDPIHMKRAILVAQDVNIEAYSSPTRTTQYATLKTQLPFLARETFVHIGYQIYRIFNTSLLAFI
ncbi:MAG: YdcF family protein [Coriobacteriia bacterium]|nr:YdcF family protein [Coriobacteriia bacterium]